MGILGRTLSELREYIFNPRRAVQRDPLVRGEPLETVASLIVLIAFVVLNVTLFDLLVQYFFFEPRYAIQGSIGMPIEFYLASATMVVMMTVGVTVAAAILTRELHPLQTLYSGIYAGAGFLLPHFSFQLSSGLASNYGVGREQLVVLLTGGNFLPPMAEGFGLTTSAQRFAAVLYEPRGVGQPLVEAPIASFNPLGYTELQWFILTVLFGYFLYIFYLDARINYNLSPGEAIFVVWVGLVTFIYEGLYGVIPERVFETLSAPFAWTFVSVLTQLSI